MSGAVSANRPGPVTAAEIEALSLLCASYEVRSEVHHREIPAMVFSSCADMLAQLLDMDDEGDQGND